MLRYNFDRIFKARGITRPFTYLMQSGFSDNIATKLKNNRAKRLDLETVERLCLLFKCTPNDLMEWIPDKDFENDGEHPLNAIRQSNKELDIARTLSSIPLARLEEIDELIREKLKE